MKTLKSIFLITLVLLCIYSCSDDEKDNKDGDEPIDYFYTETGLDCDGEDDINTTYFSFYVESIVPVSKFYATVTIDNKEYKLPYKDIEVELERGINIDKDDYEYNEYCCDVTYPCNMKLTLIKIYYVD